MDIVTFLDCLSTVNANNLIETVHFSESLNRRSDKVPDSQEIGRIILSEVPVGILKQSERKFRVIYSLNEIYDLIIVLSVRETNPLKVALITCFAQKANRRVRKDE